jgi:hypothetical protein
MGLEITQFDQEHSILQWKKVKEMKKGAKIRFPCLLQLVEGLLSIPYSNAPIERQFNQLNLTKTIKRLKIKGENLESFMILKSLTSKSKADNLGSM